MLGISTLTKDIILTGVNIRNLSISSDFTNLILPQTKLDAIPPKDVAGVAFLALSHDLQ